MSDSQKQDQRDPRPIPEGAVSKEIDARQLTGEELERVAGGKMMNAENTTKKRID